MTLYSANDRHIKGTQILAVYSDSNTSGPVFVPECVCFKNNSEYIVLQGLYLLEDGRGHIIVIGLADDGIKFGRGRLMSRAYRIPENDQFVMKHTDVASVNQIGHCLDQSSLTTENKVKITLDMINVDNNVEEKYKIRLQNLLNKYRDCFALSTEELGVTSISEMHIKLTDDTPVCYKPYRLPFTERKVVRDMVDVLLKNNIIQDSNSPYASPIVLV